MTTRSIHWFREDLRLSDNPSLFEACKSGHVIPIYIHDNCSTPELGKVSRWWLHHSLAKLDKSLDGKLGIFTGDTTDILMQVITQYGVHKVFWNKVYSPEQFDLDVQVISLLSEKNILYETYNASLMWEPSQILNQSDLPYKVFTPFFKKGCLSAPEPRYPLGLPDLKMIDDVPQVPPSKSLDLVGENDLNRTLGSYWSVGEDNAVSQLNMFITRGLDNYKIGRDFPSLFNVSKLSPYLHFGEISPNQVWYTVLKSNKEFGMDADKFLSELAWREFSYYLLYHFPSLPQENLQSRFNYFPWESNTENLVKWQAGITGYPIVDAGMRELMETGYMHNRLRMIVGSFLIKNLLIHWHHGRDWFWNHLADADIANNSAGWQWIAGCGADAAPFFRVFNPILQGKKFDPDGAYTKTYIPELQNLPAEYLFNPWEAPQNILDQSGIILGKDYPLPIVDLKMSRIRALKAFDHIKIDK